LKRIVGEDEQGCKKTMTDPDEPSVLFSDGNGETKWADGSTSKPICLPNTKTGNELDAIVGLEGGCIQKISGSENQILSINGGKVKFVDKDPAPLSLYFPEINNLEISYLSEQQMLINFSHAMLKDLSADIFIGFSNNSPITVNINAATDSLPRAANAYYWIFLTWNQNTSTLGVTLSLSPTSPNFPVGTTHARRIGVYRTDGVGEIPFGYFQKDKKVNFGDSAKVQVYNQTGTALNGLTISAINPGQYPLASLVCSLDFLVEYKANTTTSPFAPSSFRMNAYICQGGVVLIPQIFGATTILNANGLQDGGFTYVRFEANLPQSIQVRCVGGGAVTGDMVKIYIYGLTLNS
jgi:hypothetical protein